MDVSMEDDIEVLKADESYSDENVSAFVGATFQRAKAYTEDTKISSAASELGSNSSFESGRIEVKALTSLPRTFETAISINQTLQRRFSTTVKQLEKALEDNLKRQDQLKHEQEDQGLVVTYDKDIPETKDQYTAKPSSFSIPFFKDKYGVPPAMNCDAKLKIERGYMDLYSTKTRHWMIPEQKTLVKEVHKEWKQSNLNKLKDEKQTYLKKLQVLGSTDGCDVNEKKKEFEEEIQNIESSIQYYTETNPTLLDIPKNAPIDWNKVAVMGFDGGRSAEDCKLLWENKLHPRIKQSLWEEEEDIFIQQCVSDNEINSAANDWEAIAADMNTGRTAFQCMQRWTSYIYPTLHPAQWSREDSSKLEDAISMLRVGSHIPWAQVTQHLTGFTSSQVQSRWRNINPEQARGPFTLEEDFLIIKGISMFGLNFEMIAYYLPGRNKSQIRTRFKRTLLPGLTSKPWTVREDKKIMANCTIANQHWRMVATRFPGRETCEVKVRFYTLHVWQSCSKEKVLPPPLFPLSMTKNAKEIQEIREKIINVQLCNDVNKSIDKVSSKKNLFITSFEDRRRIIKNIQNLKEQKLFKEKKPRNKAIPKKRKIVRKGPRLPNWPDMALTEYFLPGRPKVGFYTEPQGKELGDYSQVVNQALQLHLSYPVLNDVLLDASNSYNITDVDAGILDQLSIEHSHKLEEKDPNCLVCKGWKTERPSSIPLIPPNLTTIGALRSLLFHKEKLTEMANKDFLFYHVPAEKLHQLGSKKESMVLHKLQRNSEEEIVPMDVVGEEEKPAPLPKSKRLSSKRKSTCCRENSEDESNKSTGIAKKSQNLFTASEFSQVNEERPESEVNNEKTIKEEDELLFQRFMSLFFWPSLFTLEKPSMTALQVSENLIEELEVRQLDEGDEDEDHFHFDSPNTSQAKYTMDLDIHEQLIDDMEKEQLRKRIYYSPLKTSKPSIVKQEQDEEEEENDRPNPRLKKYIQSRKKGDILSMKRSLVMRRVWDQRKKGLVPQRKAPSHESPSHTLKSARLKSLQEKKSKLNNSEQE